MPRCAVLGDPIEHSLSPVLHAAAYDELGLTDWAYGAHRVDERALAGFLTGLHGQGTEWRGLSLTMPLKRTVMPLLDEVAPTAALAGAANTVLVAPDGRLSGDNTDVPGAVAAIRERHEGPVRTAAVLGGGATATSTLLALADLGCDEAVVLVRDPARARKTLDAVARHEAAPRLTTALLTDEQPLAVDVVVSTIPAAAQTPALVRRCAPAAVVFEVLYDPWPTPLASAATEAGQTLVSGLDLLVHQAARQLELMTGVPTAPVAAMRQAGERALAARVDH
ncbi:shikimate dehydrogenase [Nocardioidaceae bacterium]|nr:shikimate dehydrogenase [Nocardioidaceae bacterium]